LIHQLGRLDLESFCKLKDRGKARLDLVRFDPDQLPSPLSSSACEDSKQRLRIYPEGFSQLAYGTEVGFYLVALDTDNGVNSHAGFFG
jgi:hypothetical protein